jgi:hypothetical protein
MQFFKYFLFFCLLFIPTSNSYSNEKTQRLALVIGNNNYKEVTPLKKAVNDAKEIGKTLKKLGFDVKVLTNLDRRSMNRQFSLFTSRIKKNDEVVFFYAGHGVEIKGRNFLLPIDVPNASTGEENFVINESISEDSILTTLETLQARVNIVILDACRNNPFKSDDKKRSIGIKRGLNISTQAPAEGTFIMYSAGRNEAALDRLSDEDGHPNSVFTRSLIPLLTTKGLKLTEAAKLVRREVKHLALKVSHNQNPAYYDGILGDFYFKEPDKTAKTGSSETNLALQKQLQQIEFNSKIKTGMKLCQRARDITSFSESCRTAIKQWEVYLTTYPEGSCVDEARDNLKSLRKQCQKKTQKLITESETKDRQTCTSLKRYTEEAKSCRTYKLARVRWKSYKASNSNKGLCINEVDTWLEYLKELIAEECRVRKTIPKSIPIISQTPDEKIIRRQPETKNTQMSVHNGYDIPQGDYATTRTKVKISHAECHNACQNSDRCKAYTYNTRYNKCFLKDSFSRLKAWSDAISGVKGRVNTQTIRNAGICGSSFSTFNNVDFSGNDIGGYRAGFDRCRSICLNNSSCTGFTWIRKPISKQCWLKYTLKNHSRNFGVISCAKN